MARLRAVVVIQPAGLAGTRRVGHVSSAVMNASWTASSARSKSPSDPDEVGDGPARSCRNRWSTTSCVAASEPVRRR